MATHSSDPNDKFISSRQIGDPEPRDEDMGNDFEEPTVDETCEDENSEANRERWKAKLSDNGIDPNVIKFNKNGTIAKSRPNLEVILLTGGNYWESIRWNELLAATEITVPTYDHLSLDDMDRGLTALQIHLENEWGTAWAEDSVFKVANLVAAKRTYHPVKDYLEQLPPWDEVDRFKMIRDEILGADQTPDFEKFSDLYLEFLKCTLVGAIRRVLMPGCKMDTVTILYGAQAARKSTFWRTLCADQQWFNDSKIHIDQTEGQKVLQTSWIHELSEIDDMTSVKSAEAVKAFVASANDKYRPSYGKVSLNFPRRCILVGSTNKEEVLNDPTGSRRFWVIPTADKIDIELLQENLDQIWAQAYKLCLAGEPNHLSEEMEDLRKPQSGRYQMVNRFDDLLPIITEFYQSKALPNGITLNSIFGCLDAKCADGSKGYANPTNAERRELSNCLKANGWTSKQGYIGGVSAKCYTAPPQFPLKVSKFPIEIDLTQIRLEPDPFKPEGRGQILE